MIFFEILVGLIILGIALFAIIMVMGSAVYICKATTTIFNSKLSWKERLKKIGYEEGVWSASRTKSNKHEKA